MKLFNIEKIKEKYGYEFNIKIDEVIVNEKCPELGTIGNDEKYISYRLLEIGNENNIEYQIIHEVDHCHHYYKGEYKEDWNYEKTILYLNMNFVTYEHYLFTCNEYNSIRHKLVNELSAYDEIQFVPMDKRQFNKHINNDNTPFLWVYGVKLDEYKCVIGNDLLFHLSIPMNIGDKFEYFRNEIAEYNF